MTAPIRRWWGVPAVLALAMVLWAGGFPWFLRQIEQPAPPLDKADGIVVLTGGADRIEAGLRLLAEGRATWLLISGIGGRADLTTLTRGSGVDVTPLAERIKLGRKAASTRGNARETAAWARDNGIGTLIVVTAYYHMPRALTELRAALPDVVLRAAPVHAHGGPATTRLLAEEYSKYLLARAGLTAWLPAREQPTAGHAP